MDPKRPTSIGYTNPNIQVLKLNHWNEGEEEEEEQKAFIQ